MRMAVPIEGHTNPQLAITLSSLQPLKAPLKNSLTSNSKPGNADNLINKVLPTLRVFPQRNKLPRLKEKTVVNPQLETELFITAANLATFKTSVPRHPNRLTVAIRSLMLSRRLSTVL